MDYVTREDIRKLLREKKGDRAETRVAIKITLLGLFSMIIGSIFWGLSYFSVFPNNLVWISTIILTGSSLSGFTVFFILIGEYLYYQYHEPFLVRHWLYQGVVRTFLQIFFFGSFIFIFILSWRFFYNQFDLFFLFLVFIFSLPVELGKYFSRKEKIRDWLEDLISKETKDSKEDTSRA
ncbi:MAG: hypothetical protein ACXADY_25470 [Candidatus Hodarchaeales archaeon]|jgi:hypothetical protein